MAGSNICFTNGISGNDLDSETIQVLFKMLGITNADYALLTMMFLISKLNSSQSSKESNVLFVLLSEVSLAFPDVITIMYIPCTPIFLVSVLMCLSSRFESMLNKINNTYLTLNNCHILQSLSTICTQPNKLSPASAASSNLFLFNVLQYLSTSRSNEECHWWPQASTEHLHALGAADMFMLLKDHQFIPLDHYLNGKQMQGIHNLVTAMLACF